MKSVASVKISFPTNLLHNPAAAPTLCFIESLLCRTIILLHPAAHSSIALCFHCALQHNLLHPNAAQRFYLLPLHCVSTVQYVLLCTGCTQSIRAKFRAVQSIKDKRKNKLKRQIIINFRSSLIDFSLVYFHLHQMRQFFMKESFHTSVPPHDICQKYNSAFPYQN